MSPRLLTFSLVFGFVSAVNGFGEIAESNVVGTWKFEDEESVEELTFNPDHSFRSIDNEKSVLSTPPVAEQRGTWRIEDAKIKIEASSVHIPDDRMTRSGRLDAATGQLVISTFDPEKSRQYQRFDIPSCLDAHAITLGAALREDLCGYWKMHYHTRDDYYRLLPNGEATIGFLSDEWHPVMAGQWRVEDSKLIMRVKDAKHESEEYQDLVMIVTRTSTDCFVVQNDDNAEYALRRTNDPSAQAPDASPSPAFSPPPTETPSPTR
jgi:hypothetical protein